MASPTRWTWVWVSSGSWWWTGKNGVLQSMGSQRVKHDWATKLILPRNKCLNFVAAVTVHSDFGAQENEIWRCFHIFPICLPWNDRTGYHDLHFLNVEFYANFFSLVFCLHLVPLQFLPLEWCHLHMCSISPGNLDSSLWLIQPNILHNVLCIEIKYAGWQ